MGIDTSDEGLCFACGKRNPHGLQLVFEVDADAGMAVCELAVPGRFNGWPGVCHGGIVATLLDEAIVYACRGTGKLAATVGLSVKYRKPVPTGVPVRIVGELVSARSRIMKATARIEREGEILAEAEGTLAVLPNST
ncbi:MAG: PaaI family thioesterase [Lentisphaeria bacterium]|nr:PaaI family thioesterase [Lentisphaeria bacterium]